MSATSQSAGPKCANKRHQTNPIQRVDLPGGPSSTPNGNCWRKDINQAAPPNVCNTMSQGIISVRSDQWMVPRR